VRRGSSGDISSLDLLLDTICNTFGGIVFIALLLAILAQAAGETAKVDTTAERRRLENTRRQQQVEELRASVHALEKRLQQTSTPSVLATNAVAGDLAQAMATNALIRAEVEAKEAAVAAAKASLAAERLKDAQKDREAAQIRRKIDELAVPASRNAAPVAVRRLPRVGKVAGTYMTRWVAVHKGRFHMIDPIEHTSKALLDVEFDPAVRVHHEPDSWVVELPSGGGQPIRAGCERAGVLAALLAKIAPQRHVIRFMVDPDSFAEFNYIKELLVSRGYRYMFSVQCPPYFFVRGNPDDAM
jgi:hypothetical protein